MDYTKEIQELKIKVYSHCNYKIQWHITQHLKRASRSEQGGRAQRRSEMVGGGRKLRPRIARERNPRVARRRLLAAIKPSNNIEAQQYLIDGLLCGVVGERVRAIEL